MPGTCCHTLMVPTLSHVHTLHTDNRPHCACSLRVTAQKHPLQPVHRHPSCSGDGGRWRGSLPPLLSPPSLCVTGSGVCMTQRGVCMTQSGVCPGCSRGCGRGCGCGTWLRSCARGWSLGSRLRVGVWPRRAWEWGQGGQQARSPHRQGCCASPGGHMRCGTARHRTCQALPVGTRRGAQGGGSPGEGTPAWGQLRMGVSERARSLLFCPQSAPPWGWSPCGCWTPSFEPPVTSAMAWAPTAGASTSR